jgi:hypothetical protein
MIKVSVFYPNNNGSKLNMDYYCKSHIPMVRQNWEQPARASPLSMASPVQHPGHGPPLSQWVIFISIRQKHFKLRSARTRRRL